MVAEVVGCAHGRNARHYPDTLNGMLNVSCITCVVGSAEKQLKSTHACQVVSQHREWSQLDGVSWAWAAHVPLSGTLALGIPLGSHSQIGFRLHEV